MSDPANDSTAKLVILTPAEAKQYKLEVIRAFVDRVDHRLRTMPVYADAGDAMEDELIAMEQETE